MEQYTFLEKAANDLGAKVIVLLTLTLIAFFRKLPKLLIEKLSEKRNIDALTNGSLISDEMDTIEENSLAMYNHIIYYENGGHNIKTNEDMHITIKWERTGHLCDGCMASCHFKGNIPKLKSEWSGETVSEGWRRIISRTVNAEGKFSSTTINDSKLVADEVKDIWNQAHIFTYKEVVIKHKRKGFYTLGLSYCERLKDKEIPEGVIYKSVNKLKHLL